MSYDIELVDSITGETLLLEDPHHMRGGTYAIGGEPRARLNITYNYVNVFKQLLGEMGIRSLYNLSGAESIPILEKAISKLGDETGEDYWKPTEGNVKRALIQLLALAKMRPDGIWSGD